MPAPGQVEIFGRLGVFGLTTDFVQLHAEGIAEEKHRLSKDSRASLRDFAQVGLVDRIAETHDLLGVRRVVDGGVEGLHDGDPVHPVGHSGGDDREQLHEARIEPAAEYRRTAEFASLRDAVATRSESVTGDELRGRHHVDAGAQNPHQLIDIREHRVVDHAVRLQRDQCVDVVCGQDTERLDPAQLAGVAADLVR